MLAKFGSAVYWVFLSLSSVVLFFGALLLWIITLPFDRRGVLLHKYTCFWAALYTWLNPMWQVSIEGRQHLNRKQAYVMVANHLSLLDIFVLFRLFSHFKWVSKIENFRLPFIGWNMRLNRYIELKRGDRGSVKKMMSSAERHLENGSSVMIFPEGTRSKTGELKPFKPGAFELALRAKKPILPILVEGSGKALPRKGFVLRGKHNMRVKILPPIAHRQFSEFSPAEVAQEVKRRIAAEQETSTATPFVPPSPQADTRTSPPQVV